MVKNDEQLSIKEVKIVSDSEQYDRNFSEDNNLEIHSKNPFEDSSTLIETASVGMEIEGLYVDLNKLKGNLESYTVSSENSKEKINLTELEKGYVISDGIDQYLYYEWELEKENTLRSRAIDEHRSIYSEHVIDLEKRSANKSINADFIGVYDNQLDKYVSAYSGEKFTNKSGTQQKTAYEVALSIESERIYNRLINDGEEFENTGQMNPLFNLDNDQLLEAQGYELKKVTAEEYVQILSKNDMALDRWEKLDLLKLQLKEELANNEYYVSEFSTDKQSFLDELAIYTGEELFEEIRIDYEQFADKDTSFAVWSPTTSLGEPNDRFTLYVANAQLDNILSVPDELVQEKIKAFELDDEIEKLKEYTVEGQESYWGTYERAEPLQINKTVALDQAINTTLENENDPLVAGKNTTHIVVEKEVFETLVNNQKRLLDYTKHNGAMSLGDFTGASENKDYALGNMEELIEKSKDTTEITIENPNTDVPVVVPSWKRENIEKEVHMISTDDVKLALKNQGYDTNNKELLADVVDRIESNFTTSTELNYFVEDVASRHIQRTKESTPIIEKNKDIDSEREER